MLEAPVLAKRIPEMELRRVCRIVRWEEVRESRRFVIEHFLGQAAPRRGRLAEWPDGKVEIRFLPASRVTSLNFRNESPGRSAAPAT